MQNIYVGSINFTGSFCDIPFNTVTNPCQSYPCLSGGTCINVPIFNAIPAYACVCPDGKFKKSYNEIFNEFLCMFPKTFLYHSYFL